MAILKKGNISFINDFHGLVFIFFTTEDGELRGGLGCTLYMIRIVINPPEGKICEFSPLMSAIQLHNFELIGEFIFQI